MARVASDVLNKLRERNQREVDPFLDLVSLHNQYLEKTNQLVCERDQLEYVNTKLKEENHALKGNASAAGVEQVSVLEKKLFALQEELTELHRRRGENAQQIIDHAAQLKEYEGLMAQLTDANAKSQANIIEANETIIRLKSAMSELEATNQLLKDEYQTLQLALTSAERMLVTAQKENDVLVAQIMQFKERDVMRLNQENDKAMRIQQARIKQQLAEAAADTKGSAARSLDWFKSGPVIGKESLDSAICHAVRIPTRCFLKFEAHDGEVNAIKWSPHGLMLATGGTDRKIKVWDISKNVCEQRGHLTGSNGAIMSLDYDSAGSLLLAASSDFASRVWTVEDQRLRHTLTGHSNKVLAAKFMGDSNKVVSASYDRTIKVRPALRLT
jgi:autophagy-related protein 16